MSAGRYPTCNIVRPPWRAGARFCPHNFCRNYGDLERFALLGDVIEAREIGGLALAGDVEGDHADEGAGEGGVFAAAAFV